VIIAVDKVISAVPLPRSCQISLAFGVPNDVILSSLVTAGHFFVQQPAHPSYPSLRRLDQVMATAYATESAPSIDNPNEGMIVAVPCMHGWYRAVITKVLENGECDLKFTDYGGYSRLPATMMRQIRVDFMTLPFQAAECILADVKPIGDDGWSIQANSYFEELARGQMLQAIVSHYDENGFYVHLYKVRGASQNVHINEELVKKGFAQRSHTDPRAASVPTN